MKKQLIFGESVMISRFGKWQVRSKRPWRDRDLKTGHEIVLDAFRKLS
ncbi:MAG: HU family DNA-binding protein [Desulfomonilaceae bacterium]